MAHIDSIGAGIYSDLSVCSGSMPTTKNQANYDGLFSDTAFTTGDTAWQVSNVREFPSIGTPPNIVNVPNYGQATSSQVQGQSDAPNIELTINYVSADWADGTSLGDLVGDGNVYAFRFALMNADASGGAEYPASSATGIGTVKNTYWYWEGKVEALLINPQLTDANTATLTISVQSDFYGGYTIGA